MQGWALSEYTVRFAQAAIFRLWTPSTVDRAWEVLANLFDINRAAKNAGNCVLPRSGLADFLPESQVGPRGCMTLKTSPETNVPSDQ